MLKDTQQSSVLRTRPIMTPLLCSTVSPLDGSFYSALIPQIHLNSAAITEALPGSFLCQSQILKLWVDA